MVADNHLKALRAMKGVRLMALAARASTSPSLLSAIERYGYLPRRDTRQRIATALGVDVREIWPGLKTDGRRSD